MNQIDSLGYHFSDLLNLLIQTVLSTLIVLMTAEFLPKFFQIYANGLIKFFALPAYVFYLLFYFISSFLISVSDFVLKNSLERMGIRYSFILVKSSLEITLPSK
jgi:CBS domain containing-hemolysin-like protein